VCLCLFFQFINTTHFEFYPIFVFVFCVCVVKFHEIVNFSLFCEHWFIIYLAERRSTRAIELLLELIPDELNYLACDFSVSKLCSMLSFGF
jgi:hypothetical protein